MYKTHTNYIENDDYEILLVADCTIHNVVQVDRSTYNRTKLYFTRLINCSRAEI